MKSYYFIIIILLKSQLLLGAKYNEFCNAREEVSTQVKHVISEDEPIEINIENEADLQIYDFIKTTCTYAHNISEFANCDMSIPTTEEIGLWSACQKLNCNFNIDLTSKTLVAFGVSAFKSSEERLCILLLKDEEVIYGPQCMEEIENWANFTLDLNNQEEQFDEVQLSLRYFDETQFNIVDKLFMTYIENSVTTEPTPTFETTTVSSGQIIIDLEDDWKEFENLGLGSTSCIYAETTFNDSCNTNVQNPGDKKGFWGACSQPVCNFTISLNNDNDLNLLSIEIEGYAFENADLCIIKSVENSPDKYCIPIGGEWEQKVEEINDTVTAIGIQVNYNDITDHALLDRIILTYEQPLTTTTVPTTIDPETYCDDSDWLDCKDNRCVCQSQLVYDNSRSTCVSRVGGSCQLGDELTKKYCIANSTCSSQEICQCDERFISTPLGSCLLNHNENCTRTGDCYHFGFLGCLSGRCQCQKPAVEIWDSDQKTCLSIIGGECTNEAGTPKKCISRGICNENSKICECHSDYIASSNRRECLAKIGTNCTSNNECYNNNCKEKTCSCKETEMQLESKQCVVLAGESCIENNMCVKNAYCDTRDVTCKCDYNYIQSEDGTCISIVGGECNTVDDCRKDSFLECSIHNNCTCPENYYFDFVEMRCYGLVNGVCINKEDCYERADCISEKCTCPTNYIEDPQTKKCRPLFGSVCNTQEICWSEYLLACSSATNTCVCEGAAMTFNSDDDKCVSLAGARCTLSGSNERHIGCVKNSTCSHEDETLPYGSCKCLDGFSNNEGFCKENTGGSGNGNSLGSRGQSQLSMFILLLSFYISFMYTN